MMLTTRIAAMMTSRTGASAITKTAAAFSTQTSHQVKAVESMLQNRRWTDVKDEVESIRLMMEERKTNLAIHPATPLQDLERTVQATLHEIQNMASQRGNHSHDDAFARAFGLKRELKSQLYRF